MVLWCLRATSCSLHGHFVVNCVQNVFTKSKWRSAKWTSSTVKLKRAVWVVDKNFIYVKLRGEFLKLSKKFHGGPEVTYVFFQGSQTGTFQIRHATKLMYISQKWPLLCGSGHELMPVDREATKKLRDVNTYRYWILATSRENIFTSASVCA